MDKLQKLQDILKTVNEGLTRQEFTKSMEAMMKIIVQMEKRNMEAISQLQQQHASFMQNEKGNHEMTLADMKKQVNQVFVGDRLAEMKKMIEEMVNTSTEKMQEKMMAMDSKMSKVKDGYTPVKGKDYFDGKHGNILKPTELRDKLETLPKGEKLEINAIENLREELDKLEKKSNTVFVGGGSSGGGRIVKSWDISASLNGVLKTFALPAYWRVISVHLSSIPNILRENTDYTTNNAASTITFTSQIDAASSLATGQTCVIIYSE